MPSFKIIIFVLVCAAALIYSWRRNAKLRDGLANVAKANGWTFSKRQDEWARTWRLDPFGEGSSRQCRNVIQGSSGGWPFVGLDYQYTTHNGDDSTTHSSAVTALQLAVPMPPLSVRPTGPVARIFSGGGVKLESEDFNRGFHVTADVPKFAYDVLTARTMELLLSRPPLAWHFEGPWLVCFTRGDLSPSVLLSQLDTAKQVLAGIPAFVWKDVGALPPPTA